jgi:hypothetical protein
MASAVADDGVEMFRTRQLHPAFEGRFGLERPQAPIDPGVREHAAHEGRLERGIGHEARVPLFDRTQRSTEQARSHDRPCERGVEPLADGVGQRATQEDRPARAQGMFELTADSRERPAVDRDRGFARCASLDLGRPRAGFRIGLGRASKRHSESSGRRHTAERRERDRATGTLLDVE